MAGTNERNGILCWRCNRVADVAAVISEDVINENVPEERRGRGGICRDCMTSEELHYLAYRIGVRDSEHGLRRRGEQVEPRTFAEWKLAREEV